MEYGSPTFPRATLSRATHQRPTYTRKDFILILVVAAASL
jgi:hypothetical protein